MATKVQLATAVDFAGLFNVKIPLHTAYNNVPITKWSGTLPANSVDHDVVISLSGVVAIAFYTETPNVHVKVNATSEPDTEFDLPVKEPLIWTAQMPSTMRFITTGVSHLYLTTGSRAAKIFIAAFLD